MIETYVGRPCKTHGELIERLVSNGKCVLCNRERTAAWYEANKTAKRIYNVNRTRAKRLEARRAALISVGASLDD